MILILPRRHVQAFADEMAVVLRRCEWLQAVSGGDEKKIEELLAQSTASGTEDGSRDGAAMSRAGPCCGYQDLKPLSTFAAKNVLFRNCGSKSELKSLQDSFNPARKLYQTLIARCKASVAELRSAKQRSVAAEEAAKKKRAKEEDPAAPAKKKKGKAAARPAAAAAGFDHAIFQLDPTECECLSSGDWRHDMENAKFHPFVISGVDIVDGDPGPTHAALNEFATAFNESSLKARVAEFLTCAVHSSLSCRQTLDVGAKYGVGGGN